jgi:TRAP-type C4-dicarboxylate transport system substrate-binding protein
MTFRAPVILLAASLATSAMAETRWEMPTPYPATSFQTKNIVQFVADVAKSTNGSLKITVHSSGSMIKHADIKPAVRQGRVAIGEMLISLAADQSPIYGLDTVPFLATTYEQARKLYAVQKPYLEKKLGDEGMMLLFSVPWPPQGIVAKKEIRRLSDLKGLKFRTQNAMARRIAALAGAIPTQVDTPDLANAVASGRVDAMITTVSPDVTVKDWETLNHYHNVKVWLPRNMVFVNKAAFAALTPAQQTALLDAAKVAEDRGWKASEAEADALTKVLVANHVIVVDPGAALKSDFDTMISPVLVNEWQAAAGADGKAILNAFEK